MIRRIVRERVDANAFLDPEDPLAAPYPVLLTEHRAALREILREEFPEIITLTRQELDLQYFDLRQSRLGNLGLSDAQAA
jgi:hypothetical protein